ncbi:MAG: class I SAM-dependent methyltransferase [Actinomycetota bacterium]|nr:class I SAM-dependent methyltransferase [Actinomycetota bacterium]
MARLPERIRRLVRPRDEKLAAELEWWQERRAAGGELEQGVPYYRWMFTDHFDLPLGFYRGKRLLDVGCGPRGSLEWADEAEERVGVDPLAWRYRLLHSRRQAMRYVRARAERLPFPDEHFDVISTFNSLDHVDDVGAALSEIARVAKPGATLLLLVDIDHEPTPTEPHRFGWDFPERLERNWELAERHDFERPSDNLYDNLRDGRAFDHADPAPRPGVLSARLVRRGA